MTSPATNNGHEGRFTVTRANEDDLDQTGNVSCHLGDDPDQSSVDPGHLSSSYSNVHDSPSPAQPLVKIQIEGDHIFDSETSPVTALFEEDLTNESLLKKIKYVEEEAPVLRRKPTKVSFRESMEIQELTDDEYEEVKDEVHNNGTDLSGNKQKKHKTKKHAQLGTLFGVYLPTIQNIFGVLIFIRVTWLVGMAGTIQGFLIIFFCCCSTTLTSLSMGAIATNGIVKSGGSYYMISRALGPEFGGAVGVLFFLAFTIAGSMYVIGAIEILVTFIAPQISVFGDVSILLNAVNNYRLFGTGLLIILWLICFVGVEFVAKFGPFSLACVIFSILCIYIGIFTASPEKSFKVCYLGDRILTLTSVSVDGVMMCTKNETGPIYQHYCYTNNNNQSECDPFFVQNNVSLVPGFPGLGSGNLIKNIKPRYTEVGNLIGKSIPGDRDRGEIIADITSSFFVLLAIYFPSVTGIMTGSNMSGDLKDAQKSIPLGTITAVITTSIIYLSLALCFAGAIEGDVLRDKIGESLGGGLVIAYVAWPSKWTVLIGSFLSTIGAGLQSINGAPRLLYAIAKDDIIPFLRIFKKRYRSEPFPALVLTGVIAWMGVLVGNLDYITPLITMFFLMCYLFVNLACTVKTLLREPSWRPTYRFYHWTLSLTGVVLCASLMMISSWYYALVSFSIAGGLYKYIEYHSIAGGLYKYKEYHRGEQEWGDGLTGMAMSIAQYSLLKVQETEPHIKNWRPQILVLCKLDKNLKPKYQKLVELAAQLKAGKGLTILGTAIEGKYQERKSEVDKIKERLQVLIDLTNMRGFKEVVVAKNITSGMCHLIQTCGLGGLRPNTIMMGWPYSWKTEGNHEKYHEFMDTLQVCVTSKMAVIIAKGVNSFPAVGLKEKDKMKGNIDIWWILHDGGFLVLLAFLLQKHSCWKRCRLRIFTIGASNEFNPLEAKQELKNYLYRVRIEAEVEVVQMQTDTISPYAYEKTLKMEERIEMAKQLRMENLSAQNVMDKIRKTSRQESQVDLERFADQDNNDTNQYTFSPSTVHQISKDMSRKVMRGKAPDEKNVKKMHSAEKLNRAIKEKSSDSSLVLINMPNLPRSVEGELSYMEYLETLTEGLQRVIMVRGSGTGVITIYS